MLRVSVRGEFPPQEADGDFFSVRQEMDMDPSTSSHSTNFGFLLHRLRDFRRFAFHSVNVFVCFCFVVRFHAFFFSGEKIEAKEKVRSTIQQSQKPKEAKNLFGHHQEISSEPDELRHWDGVWCEGGR